MDLAESLGRAPRSPSQQLQPGEPDEVGTYYRVQRSDLDRRIENALLLEVDNLGVRVVVGRGTA